MTSSRPEQGSSAALSCAWGRQREREPGQGQPALPVAPSVGGWSPGLGGAATPGCLGSLESAAHHSTEGTLPFTFPPFGESLLGQDEVGVRGGERGPQTHPEVPTNLRPLGGHCSITIFLESALAKKLRPQILTCLGPIHPSPPNGHLASQSVAWECPPLPPPLSTCPCT